MRKYGVFKVEDNVYKLHEQPLAPRRWPAPSSTRSEEVVRRDGTPVGVLVGGVARAGFNTPSRRLEFYSQTLVEWGWPEHAMPRYVPGHVHWREMNREDDEFDLLPNFRLPTLIHTRSPVKWLYEISHSNPLWIATPDARRYGVDDGRPGEGAHADRLLRHARVGHRRHPPGHPRHVASPRPLAAARGAGQRARRRRSCASTRQGTGYKVSQVHGAQPFESSDPDSARIWWSEVGVHQNLTFPVQPDPVSGMHCWHQRSRSRRPAPTIATATSSWTRPSRTRSTRSGWR